METAKVTYGFAHMGINANAPEEAQALVQVLAMMFGFPSADIGASIIVGGPFEIVKQNGRGTHGHIGIETNKSKRSGQIRFWPSYGVQIVRRCGRMG